MTTNDLTGKRHPLDGYQGMILGAAACTLLRMGWTPAEIHQMLDATFKAEAFTRELFPPRGSGD